MKYSLAFGRMKLGNQPPFVGYWYGKEEWPRPWRETNWRHGYYEAWANWYRKHPSFQWPRYHERQDIRRQYPCNRRHPFRPGRYSTAMWPPGGYGRFSDIRERLAGAYYAARYTGVSLSPEDYLTKRATPADH